MLVQQLCREEEVGFVDFWGCFFGRADVFKQDKKPIVHTNK